MTPDAADPDRRRTSGRLSLVLAGLVLVAPLVGAAPPRVAPSVPGADTPDGPQIMICEGDDQSALCSSGCSVTDVDCRPDCGDVDCEPPEPALYICRARGTPAPCSSRCDPLDPFDRRCQPDTPRFHVCSSPGSLRLCGSDCDLGDDCRPRCDQLPDCGEVCAGLVPACVRLPRTRKIADLRLPRADDEGTTVDVDVGLLRVETLGIGSESALTWARVDGEPGTGVLNRSVAGFAETRYEKQDDLCVAGRCELVVGQGAEKVGELWEARLQVWVGGDKVTDVPFRTVTTE